jgi:hypothetical protein
MYVPYSSREERAQSEGEGEGEAREGMVMCSR